MSNNLENISTLEKDAQSGWRIFHCLALMITNTVMIIGMVFIYLTNDWIGQVFKEIGPATLRKSGFHNFLRPRKILRSLIKKGQSRPNFDY